jgi:hypothetical protein
MGAGVTTTSGLMLVEAGAGRVWALFTGAVPDKGWDKGWDEGRMPYNEATITVTQAAARAPTAPHWRKGTLRIARDFAVPNICFISLSLRRWEKSGLNTAGVQDMGRNGFAGAD